MRRSVWLVLVVVIWCRDERSSSAQPAASLPAAQRFPAGPPVIKTSVSGTWISNSGVEVYKDGTILFSGSNCKKVSGERAKVTEKQVNKLLADIVMTGFLTFAKPTKGHLADGAHLYLRVTADYLTKEMDLRGGARSPELAASRELIMKLVGRNPCD